MIRTASTILLAFVQACPSTAQPADSSPPPTPISPVIVIAQAQETYRSGPLADDMTIRITNSAHRSRSARLTLRLGGNQEVFRLEFGESRDDASLIVYCADRVLTAANTDNENDRWVVPDAGPGIATILSHLPPLPLPQLRLASDPSSRFDQPTPYTPDVVWESAESTPKQQVADHAEVTLRGRSGAGPVQAVFDATTFRLRSFHADLAGGLALDITVVAAAPGDPSQWPITTAGRETVSELSDLVPQRGPIAPGKFVPDIAYTRADNTAWSLHAALAALPAQQPGGPIPAVALILFRTSDDPLQIAAAEASARLAIQAVQLVAAAPSSATLDAQVIAAIDLSAYGDSWPALKLRWGADAAAGVSPGWSTPTSIIDRFDPQSRAALVLVGSDRRLLAVIPLDNQTDGQSLAAEIRRALGTP